LDLWDGPPEKNADGLAMKMDDFSRRWWKFQGISSYVINDIANFSHKLVVI